MWSGTTQQNVQKLQPLQNFATRILTGKREDDHISTTIRELGWLPIKNMLQLRDVTMVFNILNGLAASYLEPMFVTRSNIHSQNSRQKNHLDTTFRRTSTTQRSCFFRAGIS